MRNQIIHNKKLRVFFQRQQQKLWTAHMTMWCVCDAARIYMSLLLNSENECLYVMMMMLSRFIIKLFTHREFSRVFSRRRARCVPLAGRTKQPRRGFYIIILIDNSMIMMMRISCTFLVCTRYCNDILSYIFSYTNLDRKSVV